ncbi:MAG: hypothetical protein VCD16_15490 [Planctomycetota bacterium]
MTGFECQNPAASQVFLPTFLALAILGGTLGAQNLPDDIDISRSPDGVVALPARVHSVFRSSFDRYTKVVAPNGGAIHFLLQSQVTNEMGVRAREILRFYITDAPGTEFGADKTAVANSMANLDATLVYFNTESAAERAIEGRLGKVDLFFQDLYASESVVEGSRDYVNNTLRDATFEEVFHLVHGAGIQPTLPAFHSRITAATNAAIAAGIYDPPPSRELPRADRPFEYIISIIDVYYGMWAHDRGGDSFGGEYRYNTRAEIEAGDPSGVAAMLAFLPPYLEASLAVTGAWNSEFTLTRNPAVPYTHKSQYLTNVRLSGTRDAGLTGNSLDNTLAGNSGDNPIDGGAGNDAVLFRGSFSEYAVTATADGIEVRDLVGGRDGTDLLSAVELLVFADQSVDPAATGSFLRGDGNDDGTIDLTDAITILNYLFLGGVVPGCLDAADADDDEEIQLTDGIYTLSFLFSGGAPPPAPWPDCGEDLGGGGLDCAAHQSCP